MSWRSEFVILVLKKIFRFRIHVFKNPSLILPLKKGEELPPPLEKGENERSEKGDLKDVQCISA